MRTTTPTPYPKRAPTAQIRVIVDTDGGVDDAAALWYLLTQPAVDIAAITIVWGNVGLNTAAASVARVLEAAGRPDIPIALGRDTPIGAAPDLKPATFIHGDDGLGNTHRPAPITTPLATDAIDLIAELVTEQPGELSLLTLGPLSNIGDLVTRHPDAITAIDRLVVMGGAARGPGNAMPFGEANIAHDPAAASAVFNAPWNQPGTMVGLDVTNIATFTDTEFALLAEHRSTAAAFLDEPIRFYRTFGSTFSPNGGCPSHDLLAAMTLVDPDIVNTELLPVEIVADPGPAWGATIVDLRQPHFARAGDGAEQAMPDGAAGWNVALTVDIDAFRQNVCILFGAVPNSTTQRGAT